MSHLKLRLQGNVESIRDEAAVVRAGASQRAFGEGLLLLRNKSGIAARRYLRLRMCHCWLGVRRTDHTVCRRRRSQAPEEPEHRAREGATGEAIRLRGARAPARTTPVA